MANRSWKLGSIRLVWIIEQRLNDAYVVQSLAFCARPSVDPFHCRDAVSRQTTVLSVVRLVASGTFRFVLPSFSFTPREHIYRAVSDWRGAARVVKYVATTIDHTNTFR